MTSTARGFDKPTRYGRRHDQPAFKIDSRGRGDAAGGAGHRQPSRPIATRPSLEPRPPASPPALSSNLPRQRQSPSFAEASFAGFSDGLKLDSVQSPVADTGRVWSNLTMLRHARDQLFTGVVWSRPSSFISLSFHPLSFPLLSSLPLLFLPLP